MCYVFGIVSALITFVSGLRKSLPKSVNNSIASDVGWDSIAGYLYQSNPSHSGTPNGRRLLAGSAEERPVGTSQLPVGHATDSPGKHRLQYVRYMSSLRTL